MDLLKAKGATFEERELFQKPLTAAELKTILGGRPARDLLDPKRPRYIELDLANAKLSDAQLLELMAQEPGVLRRPILAVGGKTIIGLKAEEWDKALA